MNIQGKDTLQMKYMNESFQPLQFFNFLSENLFNFLGVGGGGGVERL